MCHQLAIVRFIALALLVAFAPGRVTSAADLPAPSTPTAKPPSAAVRAPPSPGLSLPAGAAAALAQLPAFQPGMWEYRRTVMTAASPTAHEPDAVKKCSDPRSEIRQKMEAMMHKGCRILEMTRLGNHFRSSWNCLFADGALVISNVITADSSTGYEDQNDSRYGEKTARTVIVAKRVGDCPSAEPREPRK